MRLEPMGITTDGAQLIPIAVLAGLFASNPRQARQFVDDLADALIHALDVVTPDPDLEPDDDGEEQDEDGGDINDEPHDEDPKEASLGSLDRRMDQTRWAGEGAYTDCDAELDRSDYEPSLGSQEPTFSLRMHHEKEGRFLQTRDGNQDYWSHGDTRDREHVNEDGDPLDDGERVE